MAYEANILTPMLHTGLRYLDNQQQIQANQQMNTANLQQRSYEFDKNAEARRYEADQQAQLTREQIKSVREVGLAQAKAQQTQADGLVTYYKGNADNLHATAEQKRWGIQKEKDARAAAERRKLDEMQGKLAVSFTQELDAYLANNPSVKTYEEAIQQKPEFKSLLEEIVLNDPRKIRAVNNKHKMTIGEDAYKQIPGTDQYVITGKSDINGQPTIATAGQEEVAKNPDAIPVTEDLTTMMAQVRASALMAGYKSPEVIGGLLPAVKATGVDVETMADPDKTQELLQQNPGAIDPSQVQYPAQVAGQAGGFNIPTAPTSIAPQPVAQTLPAVEPPEQPQGFRQPITQRQLNAAASISGYDPKTIFRAAEGRGYTAEEATHQRSIEKQALAAAREDAKEERTFRRENPNYDVTSKVEREKAEQGYATMQAEKGILRVLENVNFGEGQGFWFDNTAESLKGQGSVEANVRHTIADVKRTVRDNAPQFAKAVQQEIRKTKPTATVPVDTEQWADEYWEEATKIVLLARKNDQNDWGIPWLFGGDRITTGTVDDQAFRNYEKGKRFNDWVK